LTANDKLANLRMSRIVDLRTSAFFEALLFKFSKETFPKASIRLLVVHTLNKKIFIGKIIKQTIKESPIAFVVKNYKF
jgi:hypothetical protein